MKGGQKPEESDVQMSLEFRQNGIHGNVDSYHESTGGAGANSKNMIDSMNFGNPNSPAKNVQIAVKKDPLYKTTLKGAFAINEYESFYSNNSSREDWDESKETSPDKRKSRVTYQSAECSPEKGMIKKSKFGQK